MTDSTMIAAQGRRIRTRIVRTKCGTQHIEYRVGTERYYSFEELEAEVL